MCCIKPYWNDCSIGLRQYSRTKKRYCIRYRKSVMQSEYVKRRKKANAFERKPRTGQNERLTVYLRKCMKIEPVRR